MLNYIFYSLPEMVSLIAAIAGILISAFLYTFTASKQMRERIRSKDSISRMMMESDLESLKETIKVLSRFQKKKKYP